MYQERDVPANEERASVTSALKWSNKSDSGCMAEYTVTFKNVGKASIELGAPKLKYWLVERPSVTGDVTYINPKELMSGHATERLLSSDEYANHYPPDEGDTVTSVFALKNDRDRLFVVKVEFPPKSGGDAKWSDYQWARVCEAGAPFNAPGKPPQSRVRSRTVSGAR